MTDFIGDIHGHAEELKTLLTQLGYSMRNGAYSHPERTVLFVGDYIDRGPNIPETLNIVRKMVDAGNAIALMGNHEYNALCFHLEEKEGGHLRKHSIKNILQHVSTLQQFKNSQKEYNEWIDWFLTLPLFFETDAFRAVHACWLNENISILKDRLNNGCLNAGLLHESIQKDSPLYNAVDQTLKGLEVKMPSGTEFEDKDGHIRNEIRIKWWKDPKTTSYKELSIEKLDMLPADSYPTNSSSFYDQNEKPVFFGHYWLKGNPSLYQSNICCLDYSVAKGGNLVAYRFNGEQQLSEEQFVVA